MRKLPQHFPDLSGTGVLSFPHLASALWEAGFTLAERSHDQTDMVKPPAGRAYQWMHLEHDRAMFEGTGWARVPHDRHPGVFAPWGATGNIEWSGMGLFEKPKFEVDAELAANAAKAHQNVQDWADKAAKDGFFGIAGAVEDGHGVGRVEVAATKTFENATPIPRDMQPYIVQIFEERDGLCTLYVGRENDPALMFPEEEILMAAEVAFNAAMKHDASTPKWPLLHSILLPVAIEKVREKVRGETTSESITRQFNEAHNALKEDNDGAPSSINTDS